jgi:hypothetical protein
MPLVLLITDSMAEAFEHEGDSVWKASPVIDWNASMRRVTAALGRAFSPTEHVNGGGEIDWLHS